ncbi:small GTP-binding protein, putative [Trichomonas vaginalis G3]|uniref:Small GTP-binding protein, putative n=2 Tax=Trichomonas vaginalis TaxID=5722 RepID=A0A8U0WPZ1_TRIV3|nr:small Rab GTPase RabC3 [Trichomonas vaginalis G3]AAX97469.1 small Rab GTPase RabC3 [Trichomonas vaginalis]EAX96179.1 small GTP-binding protein, putative [Trichomonas vaginalis G3]KAI5506311.1 small Rab GTPase RabC3 [Trichomonas vaginalis G3]|eukprot:XP_001309109.1 small GTP-binding protein [Trichomonas vaginalis G3]
MQSLKVVIVGDTQVGKSCIGARYTQGTFDGDTTPTIGAAFLTKVISTEKGSVRLQLWDTAGQEKFKSLAPMYNRSAGVVIIVYSITNKSSYDSAREWARDIREKASPIAKIVLVANKIDLEDERVISTQDLNTMAAEIHADYAIEVSAKTNAGISALFTRIAVLCEDGNNYMDKIGDQVIIPEQSKGGCC